MAAKKPPSEAVKLSVEFNTRLAAAVAEFGSEVETGPLLEEFQDRGVSRSSVFRWLKTFRIAAGLLPAKKKPAQKRGKPPVAVPVAAAPNPAPALDKAADPPVVAPVAVAGVAGRLPAIPRIDDFGQMGLLPVVELLQGCIGHAQDLVLYARKADGKVHNARLLMQASEHLRRSIETAAKLNDTVAAQQEMERFHRICLTEIGEEAPAVQERILNRLRRLTISMLSDA